MLYLVLFTDADDADPGLRQAHMPAHLAFLEANADRVQAAGPLFTTDGEGQGGVWLVVAQDACAIETLIRADPFFATGLRKSWQILEWRQVFANGARQI